ncbi:MAG: hypothetical protein OXR84_10380 [Magnetovibrio sp.]|nr:hypothetical protein [Magnetovibrio sp.]
MTPWRRGLTVLITVAALLAHGVPALGAAAPDADPAVFIEAALKIICTPDGARQVSDDAPEPDRAVDHCPLCPAPVNAGGAPASPVELARTGLPRRLAWSVQPTWAPMGPASTAKRSRAPPRRRA